ncbi:MAG: peroxiredoxin [Candidatus Dormiibacterota bacterium]|jgi:peroxiredoxin Q/BCP
MGETTTELPDFDLTTGGGGRLRNSDLLGHRTVLYFYPKDDTPGCTLEGREFTRLLPEFERAGVAVYGVSPDSGESHDAFAAKCELGIPLVSDPDRRLIDFFQLWVTKEKYGRSYMGVDRSTFLIGPDGRVAREWRTVKPEGHAGEVLAAVRGGADPT